MHATPNSIVNAESTSDDFKQKNHKVSTYISTIELTQSDN